MEPIFRNIQDVFVQVYPEHKDKFDRAEHLAHLTRTVTDKELTLCHAYVQSKYIYDQEQIVSRSEQILIDDDPSLKPRIEKNRRLRKIYHTRRFNCRFISMKALDIRQELVPVLLEVLPSDLVRFIVQFIR